MHNEALRWLSRPSLTRCFSLGWVTVILVATLCPSDSPARFTWDQVLCVLCGRAWLADALANVALFVPLGVAFALERRPLRRAVARAALLSLLVEAAQSVVPGRDPSLSDVIFNTLGAALGGEVARLARGWICPDIRVSSRLSFLAAVAAATVLTLTNVLLALSLPEITYFGGSASMQSSSKPLRIGGNTEPHGYFQGRIDEVRIYRRARTAEEIRSDMNLPVAMAPRSPDLVAAYDCDEGSGATLTDRSGRGNSGQIRGATWSRGRFGGALAFNGVDDIVVVPHSPSLDLVSAMTLEAWIYPTAAQSGWRAILQKEFDAYFLLAGSSAGALKPAGGGTFGLLTESLAAPAAVPTNKWTHVALTYDGAVVGLYINGKLVRRHLRWYPGRIASTTLDGMAIPNGVSAESQKLRARLLAGTPLIVRAVAAAPVPAEAPLVTLHDASRNEILLLAAAGDDVVVRLRTRAAAAELDSPAIRVPGALRGLRPGEAMTVAMARAGRRYCIEVNGRSTCALGFTLGTGWAFFAYSQVPPGWPHAVMNVVWMAALGLPFGFWARWRWETLAASLVLAAALLLPCTLGSLGTSPSEIAGALAGILVGWACRRAYASLAGASQKSCEVGLRDFRPGTG